MSMNFYHVVIIYMNSVFPSVLFVFFPNVLHYHLPLIPFFPFGMDGYY